MHDLLKGNRTRHFQNSNLDENANSFQSPHLQLPCVQHSEYWYKRTSNFIFPHCPNLQFSHMFSSHGCGCRAGLHNSSRRLGPVCERYRGSPQLCCQRFRFQEQRCMGAWKQSGTTFRLERYVIRDSWTAALAKAGKMIHVVGSANIICLEFVQCSLTVPMQR